MDFGNPDINLNANNSAMVIVTDKYKHEPVNLVMKKLMSVAKTRNENIFFKSLIHLIFISYSIVCMITSITTFYTQPKNSISGLKFVLLFNCL